MKLSEKRQKSIEQITSDKTLLKKEEFYNHLFYIMQKENTFYCAVFRDRKTRPVFYYRFENMNGLNAFVNRQKESVESSVKKYQETINSYKEKAEKIKEGTILYSSWGYEQTNINFYIILERKGQTLKVQEIGQNKTYERQDSGTTTPNPNFRKGEIFTRRVSKWAGIKINEVESASIYDGSKLYWSSYY